MIFTEPASNVDALKPIPTMSKEPDNVIEPAACCSTTSFPVLVHEVVATQVFPDCLAIVTMPLAALAAAVKKHRPIQSVTAARPGDAAFWIDA